MHKWFAFIYQSIDSMWEFYDFVNAEMAFLCLPPERTFFHWTKFEFDFAILSISQLDIKGVLSAMIHIQIVDTEPWTHKFLTFKLSKQKKKTNINAMTRYHARYVCRNSLFSFDHPLGYEYTFINGESGYPRPCKKCQLPNYPAFEVIDCLLV